MALGDDGQDNPAFQPDDGDAGELPEKVREAGADSLTKTDEEKKVGDAGPERQQWSSGTEFLMSCIAMSVGLGNVWRFPYTAYQNGGGAFLIPYIIVLIIIGRPLYYLEMGIGQFTSRGCVKAWNMIPALKGIGYGQIMASACVLTYYSSLMAITLFYFGCSFQSELPWGKCQDDWENCWAAGQGGTPNKGSTPSTEFFFKKYVLKEKTSLDEGIGVPEWRLTLCLLGAWLMIMAITLYGVKSSGKAAYFLALFPYVVLVTLLIRGATLEGAGDGVLFFITPDFNKLLTPQVWYAAVTQAFFSLNVGFGSLIVYSSYNDFRHGIYRDAMIVTSLDTFTSILAGCTIFSILGNLAHETKQKVKDVVSSGPGMAFISYPDAIAKFDAVPQLFSVLFFFMLLTLGLGSAVSLLSACSALITDNFPNWKPSWVNCCIGIGGFLISLLYVTQGGQWLLEFVDHYGVTYPVLALMCVEMGGIAWIYGLDNICADFNFMLHRKAGPYWRLTWGIITPLFLIIVLIYSAVVEETFEYENDKSYPDHYIPIGWTLLAVVVATCPVMACYEICKRWKTMSLREAIQDAFRPSSDWGPSNSEVREEWRKAREDERLAVKEAGKPRWRQMVSCFCGFGVQVTHYPPNQNNEAEKT